MKRTPVLLLGSILWLVSAGLAASDDHGNEPTPFAATLIGTDDFELRAALETPEDVDCFVFEAVAGATYVFETAELEPGVDTLLVLFDRDSRTVLAVDDDGAGAPASRLSWQAPLSGFYFLCVRNARTSAGAGGYTLRVTGDVSAPTETPPAAPPPPEPSEPPPAEPPASVPALTGEGGVAILGADDAASLEDVRDYLAAALTSVPVTVFDVAASTPAADELVRYAAVLVWADSGFADAERLGDVLADYVDAGGGVVVAAVSFDAPDPLDPDTLGGRFLSGGYYVIQPGVNNTISERRVLGTVERPDHPVMRGIVKIDGGPRTHYSPTRTLTAGSSALAFWDNGDVLVAAKTLGASRRVDVNLFPPSSRVDPDLWPFTLDNDVPRLFANALSWVGGLTPPAGVGQVPEPARLEVAPLSLRFEATAAGPTPAAQSLTVRNVGGTPTSWSATADATWLSPQPDRGELEPGASATVTVQVDPAGLAAGTYSGAIAITALGSTAPPVQVVVTLLLGTGPPPSEQAPPEPTRPRFGLIRVPGDFPTLAAAVAQAGAGATIELAPGVYPDVAMTITRSLTLKGSVNPEQVVLEGNGRDPVLLVGRNAVVALEGLALSRGGHGLVVGEQARLNAQNVTLRDNLGWGLVAGQAAQVELRNVTIARNGAGGVRVGFPEVAEESVKLMASLNAFEANAGCAIAVDTDAKVRVSGTRNAITGEQPSTCDPERKLPNAFFSNLDSDGDGIPDAEDFCPTFPGRKETNGC